MKKTLTINLSGIIFHIDEDAHDMLSDYLKRIRSYFTNTEGKEEIMTDVEGRIAEMFQQKISGTKQVITVADVNEVISMMGKPEDFAGEDSKGEFTPKNEEPSGTWTGQRRKRLFRDPDDHVLGGVCSGISHYFGIEPLWVRLIFVGMFLLWGSGFLLYILLWVIIPRAKNTSEKLEMKGERVNISNIEKAIREEVDILKKKFETIKDGAKDVKTKPHIDRAKDAAGRVTGFIVNLFIFAFRFFAKIIGVLLIATAIALIIMLLGSLLGSQTVWSFTKSGIHAFAFNDLLDLIFISGNHVFITSVALLILIGVPLIGLLYGGIRLLLGIKAKVRWVGFIGAALWIAALILLCVVGYQTAWDFSKKGFSAKTIPLIQPLADTLWLDVTGSDEETGDYDLSLNLDSWQCFFNKDGQQINFGYPRLDIVKSKSDSIEIEIYQYARGYSKKEAGRRAGNITYSVTQQDAKVTFSSFYQIPESEKWRGQQVKILVKLPVGKSVFLDRNLKHIIYDIDNIHDTYDSKMTGKTWTMLEKGLTCVGCNAEEI